MSLRFPTILEEVTSVWLSEALSVRYPGTSVAKVKTGTTIGGSATKAQLFLEYAANPLGLPNTIWAKCGWDTHVPETLAMCATEAHFYKDLAPSLRIELPETYFELIDGDGINGVVLLEDLHARNVSFENEAGCEGDLSTEAIAKVLTLQAGYHAALWKSSRLKQFEWLKPGGAIASMNVIDVYLGFWDDVVDLPRFSHVPDFLQDRQVAGRALHTMLDYDLKHGQCLVHGDAHQANLYFSGEGNPGYLDWATVMQSHWAFDVAPFLICAQSVEERQLREKEQLAFYLEALRSHDVSAPNFDEAWLAYRQHAMWIFMFACCPTEMHPEAICSRNTERVCNAIADLETLQALESC
jgi:hypothetical protein